MRLRQRYLHAFDMEVLTHQFLHGQCQLVEARYNTVYASNPNGKAPADDQ